VKIRYETYEILRLSRLRLLQFHFDGNRGQILLELGRVDFARGQDELLLEVHNKSRLVSMLPRFSWLWNTCIIAVCSTEI